MENGNYYVNAAGQQIAGPIGLVEAYEIQDDLLADPHFHGSVSIIDGPEDDDDDDDADDIGDEEDE